MLNQGLLKSISLAVGIVLLGVNCFASVPELNFSEVWGAIKSHSFETKAADANLQSSDYANSRSARHWFPEIYIDAKSFYTDDPGAILFSKLGERSITGADFAPTTMNFPDLARHEKFALGAQWMLFEGGAKSAQSEYFNHSFNSKTAQKKAVEIQEYSKAIGYYGALVTLNRKKEALLPLKSLVDGTLQRYQIGQASNPLGYSGALGLKNIQLRLNGELAMVESLEKGLLQSLRTLADLPETWKPHLQSLQELFTRHLDPGLVNQETENSYTAQAQKAGAESFSALAKAERARFLPQVGLFAEQDYYNNSATNLANSKSYGVFLRWQLFNAGNFGAVAQMKASALAMDYQARQTVIQQKMNYEQNKIAIQALLEQIARADESLKLLEEQSVVSRKLFTNGLINALQLTEVYSRRIDVISARNDIEQNLLKMKTELINDIPFEIKE